MGSSGSAGGGRAARVLRLLLLLILALAAVEYLCGSFLDASPLRTYLYTPLYNATQPTIRYAERLHSNLYKDSSKTKPDLHLKHNSTNSTTTPHNKNGTTTTETAPPSSKDLSKVSFKSKQILNMTIQDIENSSLLMSTIIKSIKNPLPSESNIEEEQSLPLCDLTPPDLGPIKVNKTDLELEWVEKHYPEIQWGGRYTPPNCTARHKVAIIVPYRDRKQHLAIFLNHMHPFLMKQQIEYGIYVIEQNGNRDFNRAKLMNVGFVESQKLAPGGWQCFIFHDIDLLPLDTRNMYSCPRQPRHMSASIDKLNFKLPYEDIFGGVSAVTREQFLKVNGFSNKYWGWGGEDDDMFYRLKKMNYHIARYKMSIARYAMLDHKKSSPNPKRYQLLSQTSKTFPKDGLSTLTYELIQVMQYHLYTHILANIDERS